MFRVRPIRGGLKVENSLAQGNFVSFGCVAMILRFVEIQLASDGQINREKMSNGAFEMGCHFPLHAGVLRISPDRTDLIEMAYIYANAWSREKTTRNSR